MGLVFVGCLMLFIGCSPSTLSYVPPEEPHLYWKTIDVTVTDVYTARSLNGRVRTKTITVHSEEYGLTETFTEKSVGWFNNISFWDAEVGQTRKATLHSYVLDSTGEVVKREIASVE